MASHGCGTFGPSPYLLDAPDFKHFDANVANMSCSASAVITFTEQVSGKTGDVITQSASHPDYATATSPPFTLP